MASTRITSYNVCYTKLLRPPLFLRGKEGKEVESAPSPDRHVLAHVFKISNDPFVGKLGIFRIYQGTVRPDTHLFVGDDRKAFKVGHLFRMP